MAKMQSIFFFKEGDQVLALLPFPGRPLQARYFRLYAVVKKISDINYVVNMPERQKTSICAILTC